MLNANLVTDIRENLGKEEIFFRAGNAVKVDMGSELNGIFVAIDEVSGIHFDISKDEFSVSH